MNKQLIAALALGASIGAGGKAVVDGMLSGAAAATAAPFVHAADLRREYTPDAGSSVHVVVYATERKPDGGTKDIGLAAQCKPSVATEKDARALMNALAKECVWP